jgi:3-oxoacyl-[acyl-carrier protein] reductase
VAVVASAPGKANDVLAAALLGAGASVRLMPHWKGSGPWLDLAKGTESRVRVLADEADRSVDRVDLVLLDATDLKTIADLDKLHETFHPWVGRMAPNGRCILVARQPTAAAAPQTHATFRAMDGFVRSVAKELGRRGSTANLLTAPAGTEEALAPVLIFMASDHSAFITGQPWHLSPRCPAPQRMPTSQRLAGKVALITGAARGIGAATARIMAREGAEVVCLDRPEAVAPLERLAQEIDGEVLALDMTDPLAPERLAEHFSSVHEGVDIVVHNAGITRDRTLAKMSIQRWREPLEVNLGAAVRATEALLPRLNRDGRIVAVSSVAGLAGNLGQSNYATSKAGLVGYVGALSRKLAPRSIAASAVAPGFIETRMTGAIPFAVREAGRRLSALNQGGLPADVGELVTFLASPAAYGLSGQVVRVCGGMLIGA